jgi:hypothetical protein
MGKADVLWEETSACTMGSAGVRVQASGDRFVEVTLGRSFTQQGLTATCTDPLTKALTVGGGRVEDWRMSQ